jgi:hypothetical protein
VKKTVEERMVCAISFVKLIHEWSAIMRRTEFQHAHGGRELIVFFMSEWETRVEYSAVDNVVLRETHTPLCLIYHQLSFPVSHAWFLSASNKSLRHHQQPEVWLWTLHTPTYELSQNYFGGHWKLLAIFLQLMQTGYSTT